MAVAEQMPILAEAQLANVAELRHARMLIDGAWVDGMSGEFLNVENPAKRCPIARVPRGDTADVNGAVAAAAKAFPGWSKTAPRDRGRMLLRIAEALETRSEELARTIALETGNALRNQARPEVRLAVDIFRYFGGLASELKGETIPLGEHMLSYTRREPIGVVGAIIPWNAPVLVGALKIAPALCAGNTIVLKAAEDAPLGVLLMAEISQEFLPRGVLNVLTGLGEECGGALAEHPLVCKLSFTGSTEVGKIIMRAAAERIVPVSLELGGKSPSIVYPDANEDWAVDGVIAAMRFTRQSQSCTAGSRLFLHADIFDSFLGKFAKSDAIAEAWRPIGRDHGYRQHYQRKAVQEGLRLYRGGFATQGGTTDIRRLASQRGATEPGLFRDPDRFC